MTGAEPSPGRLWVFRILAALGVPLCFLLLFEGGLRVAGFGHETDFLVALPRRDGVERLTPNATFGWRFFPPSLARRPVPADLAVPKPDDALRVVVLGGSAAMGIPDPAFGVGPVLGAMLEEAWPDRRVEVAVAAMTAINSHVVLPIARDVGRLEPDVVVVYLGNNEVVGPWGAGTVLQQRAPSRALVRASIRLKTLRFGQLLAALPGRLARDPAPTGWRGMALFAEQRVPIDDPRLSTVYESYRRNLLDIVGAARSSGARVVVSTVAVDLVDTPPFASLPADGAVDAWRHLAAGEADAALAIAEEILAADEDHADGRFLRGRALLALGRRDEARAELERARDLDALRFRADSRLQQVVRDVVGELSAADERIVLVDAAEALAAASPDGVPGESFFWEHVHLTFDGNIELARALFAALAPGRQPPSRDALAARLAYTPWDHHRLASEIDAMMERPPFTSQLGHEQRAAERRRHRRELATEATSAEALVAAEAAHRRAIAVVADPPRPQDALRQTALVGVLRAAGRLDSAADVLRDLTDRLPRSPGLWTDLGNVLTELGRFDEAAVAYDRLEALDDRTPDGPYNRGLLAWKQERFEVAVDAFEEAMARDPGHLEAHWGAAMALARLDRADEAEAMLRRAAERVPDDPRPFARLAAHLAERGDDAAAVDAYRRALAVRDDRAPIHYNLGVVLGRLGRDDEAASAYAAALRLDPGLTRARDNLVDLYNRRGAERARQGDLAGAVDAFRRATAVHPDDPGSHYNLAQALGLSGRIDDAAVELRAARDLARAAGRHELALDAERRLAALDGR